jgi:hypothetical protein
VGVCGFEHAKPENQTQADLYKAFVNWCGVHALGLGNCLKRKSSELSWSIVIETKIIYQHSDACAVINLIPEPSKLLNSAREFYLDVVGVVGDFEVTMTNHKFCLYIERKNDSKKRKRHEGPRV